MRSWWSVPQSAPDLVFADCIQFLHLRFKECNQFDISIGHLMMSMCKVICCVVEKGYLLWPMNSLGRIQAAFALLPFVLQGQTRLLLQVSLDFLLLHSNPQWWKGHLFFGLVLEGLLVFIELINFSFFGIVGRGIDLDYCDVEWLALEMNRDHLVIFEIAPKYCILISLVDYEGYFFSSMGFLPTIGDIMVIWIKFAHSCPF